MSLCCNRFLPGAKLIEKARNMPRIRPSRFGNDQLAIALPDQALFLENIEHMGIRQHIGGPGIDMPLTEKRRDCRTPFPCFLVARHAANSRDRV